MPSLQDEKAAIRKTALARRKGLDRVVREDGARALRRHADALANLCGKGALAGYWPYASEIDPRPLMFDLAKRGFPLALPVSQPAGMIFRLWRKDAKLVDAGFGTQGPGPEAEAVKPSLLLVPLAAFDRSGNRIGWGKGHYDRAIAMLAPVRTIGLAFGLQEVPAVPAEAHDQRLEAVLTQSEWIDCRAASGA